MKKYLKIFSLVFAILSLSAHTASAQVLTREKTEGLGDFVYVAGSPDMYPIEYYDSETESYCGVIPDLLACISDSSGIDFVYINGNKEDKHLLGENRQVEIVSSSFHFPENPYYKDYIELFSYTVGNEGHNSGLIFTTIADDETIAKIKEAAAGISDERKNGIFLNYSWEASKIDYKWLIIAIVASLLLLSAVIILIVRIRRLRKDTAYDKLTDDETGIGNLYYFKYHFKNTIGDVARNLYYLAYIVLDGSYLKTYYGDESFEDVVKFTASVLTDYTGDLEISARITESGFAFAYQGSNDNEAITRLEEIMNKLNAYEGITDKTGKVIFHSSVYHLANSDKNCEILLFNLRQNCAKIFETTDQIIVCDISSMNRIQEEKKIAESILYGFENNEFKMYLQFVVDNKTKKIVSGEALSRWDSPQKGLLGPGRYIENMEHSGLISRHDLYMFDLACRQLELWSETEFADISLSCNFTRITISEENFIDKLKAIANGYSFDRSKLAIEITEDAIEKNRQVATENMMRCKELGFRVYLDDLGSGYTSLSNLCEYPIDVVKIDREILLMTKTPRGKSLFSGIIALAHSLDVQVICEGVETEEHKTFVEQSECDFVQGWYYSKPIPLEECESFIHLYEEK